LSQLCSLLLLLPRTSQLLAQRLLGCLPGKRPQQHTTHASHYSTKLAQA
jgi:hypothetical protein